VTDAARVCVTGAGLISALAPTLAATHAALRGGAPQAATTLALTPDVSLRGYPIAPLEPTALALGHGELRYMSAAMRLLHVATRAALHQAGLVGDRRLASFGIAIGAHTAERTSQSEIEALARATDPGGRPDATRYMQALLARAPTSALRAQPGLLTGMLALLHGVQGPCLTVIDAGTAGGGAVAEACQAISDGWCDGWIAGAAFDLDDPWILLTRGCATPPLGSGAAVLILESQTAAQRRGAVPHATIALEAAPPSSGGIEEGSTDPMSAAAARCDGEERRDEMTRSFAALRIADKLGDTLAAAVPIALALGVHHLGAACEEESAIEGEKSGGLRIGTPGMELTFLLEPVARQARSSGDAPRRARSVGARAGETEVVRPRVEASPAADQGA
jgi:3-oxoacyl-(acyl-carrier-protein) synthase